MKLCLWTKFENRINTENLHMSIREKFLKKEYRRLVTFVLKLSVVYQLLIITSSTFIKGKRNQDTNVNFASTLTVLKVVWKFMLNLFMRVGNTFVPIVGKSLILKRN